MYSLAITLDNSIASAYFRGMELSQKLRTHSKYITLMALIPHIFCCGIPLLVGVITLGTTVGLSASLVNNPFYMFVEQYHKQLLMAAICGIIITGLLNLIAYRVDCRKAACNHGTCAPKKLKSFRIFLIALTLLTIDIIWYMAESHVINVVAH